VKNDGDTLIVLNDAERNTSMRAMFGMLRYEYLMQIRRWGLWISSVVLVGLIYFFTLKDVTQQPKELLNNSWLLAVLTPSLLLLLAALIFLALRLQMGALFWMAPLVTQGTVVPTWLFFVAWSLIFPLPLRWREGRV
jgi:hypothetical protein